MSDLNNKNLDEIEFSIRVHDAFKKYMPEVKTVGDLCNKSEGELLRMPNFGRKSLKEVKEIVRGMGLNFGRLNPNEKSFTEKTSMDKISQDFTYNIIDHASDAASKSLDVILQKEEWSYNDIEKYFAAHQRIMMTYKQSLQRLHDQRG